MGWDKSEDKVRTRILSAFGVHPYILGEAVSVGGYAQVAKIEERFCKRVNSDLDMLSCVVTNLVGTSTQDESLLVWWEKTQPNDPGLEWQKKQFARTNGDISQNELRAELGLPPDEDNNEATLNAGQVNSITQLLGQVSAGAIDNVQAKEILRGMGLPDDMAEKIAGPKRVPPAPAPAPVVPGKPGEQEAKPPKPLTEQEVVGQATEELKKAIDLLKAPPETIADLVMPCVKFNPNHDDQGRFATGGGSGGMAPDTGGSFGGSSSGKESYNDRIEGTQKEADREVIRANKSVAQAKSKLQDAESRLRAFDDVHDVAKANMKARCQEAIDKLSAKTSALTNQLNDTQSRLTDLKAQLKAVQDRQRARRAKKDFDDDIQKELDTVLTKMDKDIKVIKSVADDLDKIPMEVDEITKELK
jgi:hypothetical protein